MESKLLESPLLSERIKLWNKFSGRINQDGVKLDFLQKIHSSDPPSESEMMMMPQTMRVNVPNAVKQMYKSENRSPKFPLKMDLLGSTDPDIHSASRRQLESIAQTTPSTLPEQELWLSSLVSLQTSIAEYMTRNSLKRDEQKQKGVEVSIKNDVQDVKPDMNLLFNISGGDLESQDQMIEKLDMKMIKALAAQRLSQLMSGSSGATQNNCSQQKQESDKCSYSKPPDVKPSLSSLSTVKRISLGDTRARAVICPVFVKTPSGIRGSTEGSAYAMCFRSLSIGVGASNDLDLSNYGHCNFVSAKHASIFYDEVS